MMFSQTHNDCLWYRMLKHPSLERETFGGSGALTDREFCLRQAAMTDYGQTKSKSLAATCDSHEALFDNTGSAA